MSSGLATAARFNPVTYLLAALRSLITDGWEIVPLAQGLAAIAGVGLVSFVLAFRSLRSRTSRR